MNPALAKLYGLDKTASAPEEPELDLDNMTARELIALLEAEEETSEVPEKTAADDGLDLSKMSGAELLKLIQESEAEEETVEKTAGVAFYEEAGRAMARAFHSELEKSASPDEIEIDLDEITGEELMELVDAGYEFVDAEVEKSAGVKSFLKRVSGVGDLQKGMRASGEAKRMRANPGKLQNREKFTKAIAGRDRVAKKNLMRGAGKASLTAGSVGAAGVGGAALMSKRKKDK